MSRPLCPERIFVTVASGSAAPSGAVSTIGAAGASANARPSSSARSFARAASARRASARDVAAAALVHEAQVEDLAIRVVQRAERTRERQARHARIGVARGRLVDVVVPGLGDRRLELRELVARHLDLGRKLVAARGPAEPCRERGPSLRHPHARLVQPARQAHGGGAIAQVALHLARHGRYCEGHELLAPPRVVALDRVQEPDRARLHEIVVVRAAPLVPVGERLHQRHVELNEPGAGTLVPAISVCLQQATGGRISFAA
jgi:hypothetical protein